MVNTSTVELSMVFVILGITAFAARRRVINLEKIELIDFALFSCAIFWAVGPLLAFYYGGWKFIEHYSLPLWPVDILFEGYLVVVLFILGILFAKGLVFYLRSHHKNIPGLNERLPITFFYKQYRLINLWPILAISLFIWSIRALVGFKYNIWLSGTSGVENLSALPYFLIVLRSLTLTLSMGYIVWAAACFWSDDRRFYKYLSLMIIVTEFIWMFALGRRHILIWMVFVFLGFISSGRKLKLKNILLIVLVIICTLKFLFPYFQMVRVHYMREVKIGDYNAFERFGRAAVDAYKSDKDLSEKRASENMSTRPLFLRNFVCSLCQSLKNNEPMMGRAFLRSLEYVVPSAIMPSKTSHLQTEQYIQQHFGHPLVDEACTWAAVGCADFGIIGGFLYGIILGLWIIVIGSLCTFGITRFPIVGISLFGAMIACLFQVEQSPTPGFVLCRNIIIIFIFALIFRLFIRVFYCLKSSKN